MNGRRLFFCTNITKESHPNQQHHTHDHTTTAPTPQPDRIASSRSASYRNCNCCQLLLTRDDEQRLPIHLRISLLKRCSVNVTGSDRSGTVVAVLTDIMSMSRCVHTKVLKTCTPCGRWSRRRAQARQQRHMRTMAPCAEPTGRPKRALKVP